MSQILTQEEVDALLKGVSGGEIETETSLEVDASGAIPYDLTSQDRIIRGRMPTLEIINDRFARLFRETLSTSLRKMVDVSAISTDMMKFGEFLKTLPVPTSIHILRFDPLRGNSLMIFESKLVFTLVDLFLGGKGTTTVKIEGREFTNIENRIIYKVLKDATQNMERAWNPVHNVQIEHVRSEINPQFVGIVPPSDVVVVVSFDIEMEFASGGMTLCMPYASLEPIKDKLYAGYQSDHLEVDHAWLRRFYEQLKKASVALSVELGHTTLKARNLLGLAVGDVLFLDENAHEDAIIKVEGVPKFLGIPGIVRGNHAIQITRSMKGLNHG
jgi:flagellar motor switch protein FliM